MGISAAVAVAAIGAGVSIYAAEEQKKVAKETQRRQEEATKKAEKRYDKQQDKLRERQLTEKTNADAKRVAQIRRLSQGTGGSDLSSGYAASGPNTALGGSTGSTRKTALGN